MQELYQSFIDVNNIFWGDDVFHWWFYVAILLILVFERRQTTKLVFAWFSITFLLFMFSPISHYILNYFKSEWQYRARLYSILPIPYVIALGTVLLVDKICVVKGNTLQKTETIAYSWKPSAKLVMVTGICTLIILGGTDVYQQDWMQSAQNIQKVPEAVLELSDKYGKQEDVCIAVPDSLVCYVRQVNPSIYMPYGRAVSDFGVELSKENPDPDAVMKRAGIEGCNYIVVYDNKENENSFKQRGYDIYDRLTGYQIYKVTGVPYNKKSYNDKHQMTKIEYFDENNQPRLDYGGFVAREYEYDREGNCRKETFLNAEGKPQKTNNGYASVLRSFSHYSHQLLSYRFLDEFDQPVLVNGRFETRYTYDSNRRIRSEAYYDQDGQPMNRTDVLYAAKTIQYDDKGRVIGEQFYNQAGELTLSSSGYAYFVREYDQNGTLVNENYYGIDGQQIQIDI